MRAVALPGDDFLASFIDRSDVSDYSPYQRFVLFPPSFYSLFSLIFTEGQNASAFDTDTRARPSKLLNFIGKKSIIKLENI